MRDLFNLLVVCLCVMCGGCGYRSMDAIAVDPEFTDAQHKVILSAIEEVFAEIPEAHIPVYIGEDSGEGSIIAGVPKGAGPGCEAGALGATRLTPTKAPIVGFCDLAALEPDELRRVVIHELGHALTGTDDHLGPGNMMAALLKDTSDVITQSDVQFLKARF